MPRVPVHTLEDAPPQTRSTLESLQRRMGKLMNIHAEMAHAPVVLATYEAMQTALAEQGTFDARSREAIALAVGAVDGCGYCQAAHTLGGKAAGLEPDAMLAIRAGRATSEQRLDTLVAVVRQAGHEVGEVDDTTWRAALEAGWSEQELAETLAHLALNLFTNYFNHYVGTELDVPAAPVLTGPARRTGRRAGARAGLSTREEHGGGCRGVVRAGYVEAYATAPSGCSMRPV